MALVEINFDGIIGPSHNYAGLSLGNIASASNAGDTSYPRAAALQGLAKMRHNLALGLTQGFLLPLPRPNGAFLAAIGRNQHDMADHFLHLGVVARLAVAELERGQLALELFRFGRIEGAGFKAIQLFGFRRRWRPSSC